MYKRPNWHWKHCVLLQMSGTISAVVNLLLNLCKTFYSICSPSLTLQTQCWAAFKVDKMIQNVVNIKSLKSQFDFTTFQHQMHIWKCFSNIDNNTKYCSHDYLNLKHFEENIFLRSKKVIWSLIKLCKRTQTAWD